MYKLKDLLKLIVYIYIYIYIFDASVRDSSCFAL